MSRSASIPVTWRCLPFDALLPRTLYALLQLRSAVFVVEQRCAYQELDGLDQDALHLVAWEGAQVAACLRLLAPGVKRPGPVIGRVLTRADLRGHGLGGELMRRGLAEAARRWPGQPVQISAQAHLQGFYGALGFATISDPYDEDGIPHVGMRCDSPALTTV